jgi:hypothetical protein
MANRLRCMRVISSTLATLIISVQVACNGKTSTAPSGPAAPVSFSIVGDVQDIAWRPVRGAKVELTVGTNAGTFATTDDEGRFTLPVSAPALGSFTLQASKEGLSPNSQSFDVRGYNRQNRIIFRLTEQTPLLNLAGEHTLELIADSTCEALPSLARRRTYYASIWSTSGPADRHFTIRLSGASFRGNDDSLSAVVATEFIRFFVFPGLYDSDEARPIVEALTPDTFLAFVGSAQAVANPIDRVISARFNGWIGYCPTTPSTSYFQCPVQAVGCQSSSHQLILTRK